MTEFESNPWRYCEQRLLACVNRFEGLEKLLMVQLRAHEKSVEVAKEEMNRRLEGMNEFRAQLEKQTNTFIDVKSFNELKGDVFLLREWKSSLEGKSSISVIISIIAVIISAIIGVLTLAKLYGT